MSGRIDVRRDGGLVTLTIDRPDQANALTPELAGSLTAELHRAGADGSVRVVALRGRGDRAFCAGFDLGRVTDRAPTGLDELMAAIDGSPVPTIAVLAGAAVGAGFELACRCDLRVACPDVRVGLPAVRLGVAYRVEGLAAMLVALRGDAKSLLTGQRLTVEQVPGFAHVLVAPEDIEVALADLVEELTTAAPAALSYTTRVLRQLMRASVSDSDTAAFVAEREAILAGPDLEEAVRARAEQRSPNFASRPLTEQLDGHTNEQENADGRNQ